jgi:flagellar biogenesis protein FliO
MLLPIVFLPLAAVLINDVKIERSEGAITVDIATSEPVASTDVRGMSGGTRRMYLYVQSAIPSRDSFSSGSQSIVAYRRSRYTKLGIPTDSRCGSPLTVEPTPSGIRVRAFCRDHGLPSGAPPVRVQDTEHSGKPLPEAPLAALARMKAENDSLRAALTLPPEANRAEMVAEDGPGDGQPAAVVGIPEKKEPMVAAAPMIPAKMTRPPQALAAKPAVASPKVETSEKAAQPDAPMAAIASVEAPGPSGSGRSPGEAKSSSSMLSTFLAAAILVGLAVAAVWFARRRASRTRMIRIVETASIGPRRSLVVACIGGRTMVLGVSEAGVSLLDAPAMPVSFPTVPETEKAPPLEDPTLSLRNMLLGKAQATTSEDPKQEGSLLRRLFHRAEPSIETDRRTRAFDEVLSENLASENFASESFDDQELRRKLALGEAGRVA